MTVPLRTRPDSSSPQSTIPLAEQDVAEFQALMKESCGVELSTSEAWSRAIELLNFFRMLLGPIPDDPERNDA